MWVRGLGSAGGAAAGGSGAASHNTEHQQVAYGMGRNTCSNAVMQLRIKNAACIAAWPQFKKLLPAARAHLHQALHGDFSRIHALEVGVGFLLCSSGTTQHSAHAHVREWGQQAGSKAGSQAGGLVEYRGTGPQQRLHPLIAHAPSVMLMHPGLANSR